MPRSGRLESLPHEEMPLPGRIAAPTLLMRTGGAEGCFIVVPMMKLQGDPGHSCRDRYNVTHSKRQQTESIIVFETNFTQVDWWIVAVYLVGVGVIGVVVNRYIHNVSDYIVGGRGSRTALNTATFIGTGLGLVTIMYAAIDGFKMGFSFMILGLIGMTSGLILGSTGFVIKRLRGLNLMTIPEYHERRYNRGVRIFAGIVCAVAGIVNMGLFPKMGATFITYATDMGRSAVVATAEGDAGASGDVARAAEAAAAKKQQITVNVITSLLIVLVLVYTVMGGMVSVIVTDYLQFVILSIGLGLGLYFCLAHPDLGWENMVGALEEHRGERAFNPFHKDSYGLVWVIWMAMHYFAAAICWAPEASRSLTAKDTRTAKRTFLAGAPGQFIRLAIPALLAIAAFCMVSQSVEMTAHFFPDGLSGAPYKENARQALPLLLGKIVPSGLLGLLVAGLMAAFMSTHDSYFLCWSSVIVRDVIEPIARYFELELSDKQQIKYTRMSIVCIGAFLLVWGIWFTWDESVWTYMAITGSIYLCGTIVVLVGGMYWKRASSAGAIAALAGGFLSAAVLFMPAHVRENMMLIGVVGLSNYVLCAILFVVFSLMMPDQPKEAAVED